MTEEGIAASDREAWNMYFQRKFQARSTIRKDDYQGIWLEHR